MIALGLIGLEYNGYEHRREVPSTQILEVVQIGKNILFRSFQQLNLSWSQTLERLLEPARHPSRALNLSKCMVSGTTKKQGHGRVCCANRRLRNPRTVSRTVTQTCLV